MDTIANERERRLDSWGGVEPRLRSEPRDLPVAVYTRHKSARLPWRWTVLIITTLSTLAWIGILLVMIAVLD
jgi:hypothetical protein